MEFAMKIESAAFGQGEHIPVKYTCIGSNVSPPLTFKNVPANAKSLALIVDDPDAPKGTFDHWIVWNIAPHESGLPEDAKVSHAGKNSYQELHYRGPCPPSGKAHRYFFKLYALDIVLDLPSGVYKDRVEEAMKDHILAEATLIGLFQR